MMKMNVALQRLSYSCVGALLASCGAQRAPVDVGSSGGIEIVDDADVGQDDIDDATEPDIAADSDQQEGITSSDSSGPMDGSCELDAVIPDDAVVGSPCEEVGQSYCAQSPRSLQGSLSSAATTGTIACLPTDRITCQQSVNGAIWERFECNAAGDQHPCLALPKSVMHGSPWDITQSGSGCREVGGTAICCPALLHAGGFSSELSYVPSCPIDEANKRVCKEDGKHMQVCHVMPKFDPPGPNSLPGTPMPSNDLASLQTCANQLPGCTYLVIWRRDSTAGKLHCDLPNTFPPKAVDIVPRCIMDNGMARWAKTCSEHFNAVADP